MNTTITNGAVRSVTMTRTPPHVMHATGRGGRSLDPYAPIEKVPLYTADEMRSRAFSVRLEDEDAEAGWQEVGTVSADYLLVPNTDVHEMAHDIAGRSGLRFAEALTFFDGKRYALALVARSERVEVEGGPVVATEVGDYVSLGLLFENSYDGSCRLGASLFAYRLACSNGMLASDLFARVRFRHSRESRGWEDELARSLAMLAGSRAGLRRFARSASRLAGHGLGTRELATLRTGYLDRLPVTLWGKVVDRYLQHEAPTAWGLMNAGTHELWHAERMTRSDFSHNAYLTANLLRYADEALDTETAAVQLGRRSALRPTDTDDGTRAATRLVDGSGPEATERRSGDGGDGSREAA